MKGSAPGSTLLGRAMSGAVLISIIDDDAMFRDGIQQLVESFGFKAVTFGSAEHFLKSEVMAETKCLITDLHMPGLSGLELRDRLWSQGYDVPVIVVTAYPNEKNRRRAFALGAVGFLSKPFDGALLLKYLSEATKPRG